MKKWFLFLSMISVMMSCNSAGGDNKYTLTGTVKDGANKNIHLEKLSMSQITVIDSGKTDAAGKFRMSSTAEKGFYRLRIDDKAWIMLLENQPFTLDLNLNNYTEYKISGPAANTEFQEAAKVIGESQQRLQSMKAFFEAKQKSGTPQDSLQMIATVLQTEADALEQKMKGKVEQAKDPLVALYYGSFLRLDKYPEENKKILSRLEKELPNSSYTKEMKTQMDAVQEQLKAMEMQKNADAATAIGAKAPEIAFPNPEGKVMKLSDLKGKVVLVDFWASWCRPCRMENPNVVAAYNKFKDKGFTVFSVSLDQDGGKWKGAIMQDGLIWENHVSDLKGWGSMPAHAYGVTGIPAQFLLDKEGKIVAKNLRGDQLESKLAELLK